MPPFDAPAGSTPFVSQEQILADVQEISAVYGFSYTELTAALNGLSLIDPALSVLLKQIVQQAIQETAWISQIVGAKHPEAVLERYNEAKSLSDIATRLEERLRATGTSGYEAVVVVESV